MLQSPALVSIIICAILAISAIWLFVQGYVNLKSGKKTKFGFDAFMYSIDVQIRSVIKLRSPSKWNDAGKIKVMGVMAIIIAITFARAATMIFLENILIYIK